MKHLFFLPFCCVLFVLSGLMASCGKPTLKQEPAAIPTEPAVEKPAEKPDSSAAVAVPEKPQGEEPAAKPEVSEAVAAPEKPQGEEPAAKPEVSEAVAGKKEPAATPAKPQVEKPAAKPEVSKPAAVPDKAQLEQAAKAIAEAARRETEKKNAPKVKAADLPVIEVTVKQSAYFEYNTRMGGDEQGAIIKVHPKHAMLSVIERTDVPAPVFQYRSQPDYVGKDSVEFEYSDYKPGSGPDDPGTTTITRQVINFTVVEKKK
ncbi:MAG: hypothetical protein VYB34_02110 [Planctomycetota bacterium]|nr:hypothetical protein [Planctomycetota bacterium]